MCDYPTAKISRHEIMCAYFISKIGLQKFV